MGVRGHYTFSLTLDKGHFITVFRIVIHRLNLKQAAACQICNLLCQRGCISCMREIRNQTI